MKFFGPVKVMSSANLDLQLLIVRHIPGCLSHRLSLTRLAGLTGTSWRIDDNGQPRWLAKPLLKSQNILGINRHKEYRVLQRIFASGLSPQPILLTNKWLICSWVDGQILGQRFSHLSSLSNLADGLVRLHRQSPTGFPLDLKRRFERYMCDIDGRRLSPRWLSLHQRLLGSALPSSIKLAPVHLDLHGDNVVKTPDGMKFIDWEYAVDADIAFELAALCCGNDWDKSLETDLLQRYINAGGYHDSEKLTSQVDKWKPYVDYLMLLWFETRWQQTKNQQYIIDSQTIRMRYGI